MRWLLFLMSFYTWSSTWTIHLQQVPLRFFLQSLADVNHENIMIGQNVQGKLDIHLEQVTWEQIWEFLQKSQQIQFQRMQGIIWIEKAYNGLSTDNNKIHVPSLNTYWRILKFVEVKKVAMMLQDKTYGCLSPFGKLIVDEATNSLWVSDIKDNIDVISSIIERVDKPSTQVEIQARIVNINKNEAKDLGIRLAIKSSESQNPLANMDLAAIPLEATPISYAMVFSQLGQKYIDAELSALEGKGRAQVMSSPRLLTANQQESSIASGEDIPYQETSLNGATSVAFKKALLRLKVKPYVLSNKNMMLDIDINQDSDSGRRVQGVPIISTKSMHTRVYVHSGDTLVLGGIAKRDSQHEKVGLPILKDIPLLGYLFSRTQTRNLNEELILFLTPSIH
jgi:type IV pilus assembly protein PilQ